MVQNGSDGSYRVSGDVTFRGVLRHYQDLMTMEMIDERTISLTGSSRFDIRDFGMQPPKVLVLKVEPEVDVKVRDRRRRGRRGRTGRVGGSGRPCVWAYRGSCGRYRRPIGIWQGVFDVSGVTRVVNIGLLEDEPLVPGDWVLIHVGFAMSKIDEEEAELALAALRLMGQAYEDELHAFGE